FLRGVERTFRELERVLPALLRAVDLDELVERRLVRRIVLHRPLEEARRDVRILMAHRPSTTECERQLRALHRVLHRVEDFVLRLLDLVEALLLDEQPLEERRRRRVLRLLFVRAAKESLRRLGTLKTPQNTRR